LIYRFDVDPLTGAAPADNQDGAKPLQISAPGATARPKSASSTGSSQQKSR